MSKIAFLIFSEKYSEKKFRIIRKYFTIVIE